MIADKIIMVRPSAFRFNSETAADNAYQVNDRSLSPDEVQARAADEFSALADALRGAGVKVDVLNDDGEDTPDSIFPNNTFVTFPGKLFLCPMYSDNRKKEFPKLRPQYDALFDLSRLEVLDFSHEPAALEGTGAMVLDRFHAICYAALSARSDEALLRRFCDAYGMTPVSFRARHHEAAVYHTNVIMTVAEHFALIAEELITEGKDELLARLKATGKEIIPLSADEVDHFCGNCLELMGDEPLLVMSEEAYEHLAPEKNPRIEKYDRILHVPLPVISQLGGGSARCMIAENFIDA